jgi:hypothetical protein
MKEKLYDKIANVSIRYSLQVKKRLLIKQKKEFI